MSRINKIPKKVIIFACSLVFLLLLAIPVKAVVGEWSDNGSNIYYNDGSIGIGTDSPLSALEVVGNNSSVDFNALRIGSVHTRGWDIIGGKYNDGTYGSYALFFDQADCGSCDGDLVFRPGRDISAERDGARVFRIAGDGSSIGYFYGTDSNSSWKTLNLGTIEGREWRFSNGAYNSGVHGSYPLTISQPANYYDGCVGCGGDLVLQPWQNTIIKGDKVGIGIDEPTHKLTVKGTVCLGNC